MSSTAAPAPASTKKAAKAPSPPAYEMVKVKVAEMVLWYEDRFSTNGRAAFVTDVFDEAVDLNILVAGASNFMVKTGVRWKQDPNVNLVDSIGEGVFEVIPQKTVDNEKIANLEEELVGLRLRVSALEGKDNKPGK